MNILLIQEMGRHEKNEEFREALNLKRSLDRIENVKATVWGLNYENFQIPFDEIIEDCDVVILLENYDTGWVPNISKFKGLKIFWSIDSHCVLNQHIKTCNENNIDLVLNAIESDGRHFANQKTVYFPNAYPADLIYPLDINKTIDVGFCGNINNRGQWIYSIPNVQVDVMKIGKDMVNVINSYKIHFNRNISNDINYRTFETLGCKTFLITNYTENLERLYDIGKHLVVYENSIDLSEKINYYLNNDEERNKIVNAGYKHTIKHHTFDKRACDLLSIIETYGV